MDGRERREATLAHPTAAAVRRCSWLLSLEPYPCRLAKLCFRFDAAELCLIDRGCMETQKYLVVKNIVLLERAIFNFSTVGKAPRNRLSPEFSHSLDP
jgi:hypothetical protein